MTGALAATAFFAIDADLEALDNILGSFNVTV
jgi:hypothetical protein